VFGASNIRARTSNVRRFESSDSYAGLLGAGRTTRETAMFTDGVGHLVQSIREADVCLGVGDDFIAGGKNPKPPFAGLKERCTGVATGIVTSGTWIDALGRDIRSFESYPIPDDSSPSSSGLRFKDVVAPPAQLEPLVSTTYDGAGRPLLVESRLSLPRAPNGVQGAAQYRYRVVPEEGDRLARFEALSLSPRCTARRGLVGRAGPAPHGVRGPGTLPRDGTDACARRSADGPGVPTRPGSHARGLRAGRRHGGPVGRGGAAGRDEPRRPARPGQLQLGSPPAAHRGRLAPGRGRAGPHRGPLRPTRANPRDAGAEFRLHPLRVRRPQRPD
jgi:hypothetical protein